MSFSVNIMNVFTTSHIMYCSKRFCHHLLSIKLFQTSVTSMKIFWEMCQCFFVHRVKTIGFYWSLFPVLMPVLTAVLFQCVECFGIIIGCLSWNCLIDWSIKLVISNTCHVALYQVIFGLQKKACCQHIWLLIALLQNLNELKLIKKIKRVWIPYLNI